MTARVQPRNVFINCPFSRDYHDMFRAIVYTVVRCGFTPRCTREDDDNAKNRYAKILGIIRECDIGIHDISMTDIDRDTDLPRFNMPFELGLFLASGIDWKKKAKVGDPGKQTLILDSKPFRYRDFLSDIAGQDIKAHRGEPGGIAKEVANWLRRGNPNLPGGTVVAKEFAELMLVLPAIHRDRNISAEDESFDDFLLIAIEWLKVRGIIVSPASAVS